MYKHWCFFIWHSSGCRSLTQPFVCFSHSFLPCSEKICMAVTEMAALFPKVRWLPTASCPSPEQLRDLFVWKQPKGILNYLFGSGQPCSLHYLVLYLPFIALLCFMFTLTHTTHWPQWAFIYGRCHVAPLSSLHRLSFPHTEAELGDRARVSVSAHFERQPAPRRVPEGRGAQPLPVGHPAGHTAGHPVRLWHCQSCQATCHCDNQRKQQLTN